MTKKKCEDCSAERSRLYPLYDDTVGGYKMLCRRCVNKKLKEKRMMNNEN